MSARSFATCAIVIAGIGTAAPIASAHQSPYGTRGTVQPYGTRGTVDPYGTRGTVDPYGTRGTVTRRAARRHYHWALTLR